MVQERKPHLRVIAIDGRLVEDAGPPPEREVDGDVQRQRRAIRQVKEQLRRLRAGR